MKNCLCFILLGLLFSFILFSCTKYTGPEEPVITLVIPSDTTTINAGDTIEIKGTVSDNKDLHEFYLTIKNNNNDSVVANENPYVHGAKTHNFDYWWITRDSAIYTLSVKVLDHENHSTTKEVLLHVN